MNEVQWKTCSSVRLDQLDAEPDKQDALCLLSIFEQADQFKQHNLTKPQLNRLAEAFDDNHGLAAASQRIVANFDRVSHQIEPRNFPVASSVVGTFSLVESRILSKLDLEKIVHGEAK